MLMLTTRLKPIVELLNRSSGWLLLLAIGWLCWTAARLLWLLVAAPIAPSLPLMPLQNNQVTTDYSGLYAIFADPAPATAAIQPPPNVLLKGVLLAVPDSLSSALLEINGEVKNYRIGESLQNSGYILVAVDWNAVVIADANEQQTVIRMADAISLDQRGLAAGAVGNARLPDGTQNTPMQNMAMQDDSADNTGTGSTSDNSLPASPIDEAVTALQENPASYLSQMGVMASGEGYQVTAAMPAGVRSRLGVEPGDKVLSVNGQPVGNNPGQDAGLLQQVQQAGEAKIEVKRGDQVITIRQQF